MKKRIKAEISIAVGLIVAMLVSVCGFGVDCAKVRNNVVRLHILANSDSDADQSVKLLVRDALLESGMRIFSGSTSVDDAVEILEDEQNMIVSVAEKVLRDNGFDYNVSVTLEKEYFATRVYDGFTMPAGEYLALRIKIGTGEGKNWWCVMFPPLCLPAASEQTDIDAILGKDGTKLIKSNSKYEMRFKIVELFERIKNEFEMREQLIS